MKRIKLFFFFCSLIFLCNISFASLTCVSLLGPTSPTKAYTSLIEDVISPIKKATTGVEVEAMIPNAVGLKSIADHLFKELSQAHKVDRVFFKERVSRNFKTPTYALQWTSEKGHHYSLEVKQDFSVRPKAGYKAVEIVSPVLRNKQDAEEFFSLIDSLNSLGLKQETNKSGVHVHVGVPGLTNLELGLIGWAFSLVETSLKEAISFSSMRTKYVRKQPEDEVRAFEELELVDLSVSDFLEKYYAEHHKRGVSVNMSALKKFETIEVRLFNSSVNPRALRFARHISMKIILGLRNKDKSVIEALVKLERGQMNFIEFLYKLGLDVKRTREVFEIIKKERQEDRLTPTQMLMRSIRVIPKHLYEGLVKGRLVSTPKDWEARP